MRRSSLKRLVGALAHVLAARPTLFASVALAVVLAAPEVAFARPGGGESYGGGGGFVGGGGGGGGGGDGIDPGLILYLILFLIEHPVLGSIVIVVLLIVHFGNKLAGGSDVDFGHVAQVEKTQVSAVRRATRRELEAIRGQDPAFSLVVFEDFLHLLYGELQRARARGQLARVGPYASPEVQALLASDPGLERVDAVVIGAIHPRRLSRPGGGLELELEIESNLGEVRGGQVTRFYVVDRLVLSRRPGARSREPKRLSKLDCPNCGAPLEMLRGQVCGHCGQNVAGGRFDWTVTQVARLRTERRPPLLTGHVEERGTELPTRIDGSADRMLAALRERDPAFEPQAFLARVNLVFHELNAAWSENQLARARGYVSDALFESFQYWVDVYREANARNVIEEGRVLRIDLARVATDPYFDTITVRIFAQGRDYVLDERGKVLKGSRHSVRTWSEYWTMMRGHVSGRPTRTDASCPNCGAPMQVDVAGTCGYCGVKITSGDFDWVLSKIEQDEAYEG